MSQSRDPVAELFGLHGRVALVTGAGAGIGRAIAALFARAGAHTVVADRDAALADAAVAAIRAADGSAQAHAVTADVSDPAAVRRMFDAAEAAYGTVDVLVNNAGIYYFRPFAELSVEDLDRIFAVNVRGVFLCTQEAVRRLRAAGRGGSIVNLSSVNSTRAVIFDNIHYGSSKAAVNGLTASAALEFAEYGIRVNAILPGSIATEGTAKMRDGATSRRGPITQPARTPLGRRGEPADIAAAALYLASDAASYVTGQQLAVDGGFLVS